MTSVVTVVVPFVMVKVFVTISVVWTFCVFVEVTKTVTGASFDGCPSQVEHHFSRWFSRMMWAVSALLLCPPAEFKCEFYV